MVESFVTSNHRNAQTYPHVVERDADIVRELFIEIRNLGVTLREVRQQQELGTRPPSNVDRLTRRAEKRQTFESNYAQEEPKQFQSYSPAFMTLKLFHKPKPGILLLS